MRGTAYQDTIFLSTPSARRATCQLLFGALHPEISIHALREEGDRGSQPVFPRPVHFYPRPPRGGRLKAKIAGRIVEIFLSTPSARRATGGPVLGQRVGKEFLSTPSARRATSPWQHRGECPCISIHALREEGDRRSSARAACW